MSYILDITCVEVFVSCRSEYPYYHTYLPWNKYPDWDP